MAKKTKNFLPKLKAKLDFRKPFSKRFKFKIKLPKYSLGKVMKKLSNILRF